MTGLLDDVLRERGDAAGPPQLDVGAIVAEGDRRVRRSRRRAALVAATAAVVTVGVGGLPGLLDPPRRPGVVDTPAAPFGERRVSWATGSTIHWGALRYDVGVDVSSYVQTDDGFVLTDRSGGVHFHDGTGTERIGTTVDRELRSDDSGSLVAWVSDDGGGEGAPYVVYDTGSRREVARVGDDVTGTPVDAADGGPVVYAVDGDAAYWRTGEGIVRYDVSSGATELLSATQRTAENPESLPRGVVDVADGTVAWNLTDLEGTRFLVGDRIGPGGRELPTGYNGTLSPDGSVAAVEEGDETRLYDTRTGEELSLDLASHPYRFVFGWVDAATAMTIALKDPGADPATADVLLCDVRAGDCEVVTTITLGRPESFVVPSGTPMT